MPVYVSPGAYVREVDLSLYAPQISTTLMGSIGTATKGPVNTPRYISSLNQFIREFGPPSETHMGTLSHLQFLSKGNQSFYTRITDGNEVNSSTVVTVGEGPARVESSAGPYAITAAAYATVQGIEAAPYLVTTSTIGSFTSGDASGNLVALLLLADGEFAITYTDRDAVSSAATDVGPIDLTLAVDLPGVATAVEAAIQALGAPFDVVTVAYTAPNFVVSTGPWDTGSNATIVIANHSIGAGSDLTLVANMDFDGGAGAVGVDGNDIMNLSVDGGAGVDVRLTAGAARTAQEIADDINIQTAGITAWPETIGANDFVYFRSNTWGAAGTIVANAVDATVEAYTDVLGVYTSIVGDDGETSLILWVNPFGYYRSGDSSSNFYAFQGITDGSLTVDLDGIAPVNVPAMDFSLATDMDDVALALQTAINATLAADGAYIASPGTEECRVTWSSPYFFITSNDQTLPTLGAGSTVAVTAGATGTDLLNAAYFVAGPGAVAGAASQSFTIASGAAVNIDVVVSNIAGTLTAASVENYQDTIRIESTMTGPAAVVVVDSTGTADFPLGFDNLYHLGTPAGATTFTLYSPTPGVDGDSLSAVVSEAYQKTQHDLWVTDNVPPSAEEESPYYEYREAFKLDVYYSTQKIGSFDNLTVDDPAAASFIETVLGTLASDYRSDRVVLAADAGLGQMPDYGTFQFADGNDGIATISDADYIGVPADIVTGLPTGLYNYANSETFDVNIIIVPGQSTAPLHNAMISVCETRNDCMAILDPPFGLDGPQGATQWANRQGPYNGTGQPLNSSYAATYWPWIKVYDQYNDAEVWTPPSGHVAAVFAYNDRIADPWIAPAGFNRAHLTVGLDLESSPNQGDRDLLYSYPNIINPIVNFFPDGITIWGQKTCQRQPTATDRINVRRMLLYARKLVATSVRYLVFEPNDVSTWTRFKDLMNPIFLDIQRRRGIYEFRVVMDETTNPPELIDRNEMNGRIYIKPTKSAEIITVDFVLTTTGASFDEIEY